MNDYLWAERDALVASLLQLTKAARTWEGRPDVNAQLIVAAALVADAMDATSKARDLAGRPLPEVSR